jgi:general secretion pathway protein G
MEVLLVLVILVILGGLAATTFQGTQEGARIDAAQGQVDIIKRVIPLYHHHMGAYPTSLNDLMAAPGDAYNVNKWRGPYLEEQLPLDPWGNDYRYEVPGKQNPTTFDIWSAGPDGVDGSEDDLGNWRLTN